MNNGKEIKDGLYLFYVKDGQLYPIVFDDDNWNMLQHIGNAIVGGPIQVIDKAMATVERWK